MILHSHLLLAALLETTSGPGATDCPDAGAMAAIVNDGLGRVALVPAGTAGPAAPVRVAVTFDRVGKGYAATVRVGDGRDGTRKLSDVGPGCGALANAVGILLALVLDSPPDPSPPPPPSPSPSSSSSSSSSSSPSSSPTPRAITADLGVGGGVAQGLVGSWSPAVGLGGTLAYNRWAARLGAVWLPANSNAYGPGRVEVGLAAARLALCFSLLGDRSRLSAGVCAQQQIGWMRGRGVDYEAGNRIADHLWLATGAAMVAGGPLGRSLGWEVEVGALFPFQQERFVVDNLGTGFRSGPVAFMTTFAFTTRVW